MKRKRLSVSRDLNMSDDQVTKLKEVLLSNLDRIYKSDIINMQTMRSFISRINKAVSPKDFKQLALELFVSKNDLSKIGVMASSDDGNVSRVINSLLDTVIVPINKGSLKLTSKDYDGALSYIADVAKQFAGMKSSEAKKLSRMFAATLRILKGREKETGDDFHTLQIVLNGLLSKRGTTASLVDTLENKNHFVVANKLRIAMSDMAQFRRIEELQATRDFTKLARDFDKLMSALDKEKYSEIVQFGASESIKGTRVVRVAQFGATDVMVSEFKLAAKDKDNNDFDIECELYVNLFDGSKPLNKFNITIAEVSGSRKSEKDHKLSKLPRNVKELIKFVESKTKNNLTVE